MPVVEKREPLKNSCIPDEEGFRRYQASPEKYHGQKFAIPGKRCLASEAARGKVMRIHGSEGYLFPRTTSQVAVLAWIFGDCREGKCPMGVNTPRLCCGAFDL